MSTWKPPGSIYHLRVFAVSLVLVFLCLVALLFGVRMEAIAPATGLVTARELQEVRALLPGLVEPGWWEGDLSRPDGSRLSMRVDAQGNGLTDPALGPSLTVEHFQLIGSDERLAREALRFHRLEAGDEVWPGQVLALVRPDAVAQRTGREAHPLEPSFPPAPVPLPADAVLRVPAEYARWQVVDVPAARYQALQAGDVIARIVPLDLETGQPRELLARLELEEKHVGDLTPGQTVRLFSTIYNHRLHGHAEAVLERLEPWGLAGTNGARRFHAVARIAQAPFRLPLGSSFKAEVVVGRKPVYRIILEQ